MLILLRITLLLITIMFWLKIKILIQVAIINLRSHLTAFRPHKSWGQFTMLGLWVIPWTEKGHHVVVAPQLSFDGVFSVSLCPLSEIILRWCLQTLCVLILFYISALHSHHLLIHTSIQTMLHPHSFSSIFWVFFKKCKLLIIFQHTFLHTGTETLLLLPPHIFYLHGLDNTKETIMYVLYLVMQTFHCLNFYLHWPSSGKLNPCKMYLFYVSFFPK